MKASFFNADGTKLHYVQGPDKGPAIAFIPAQSATWKNYEPVFKYLVEDFQIYALSIRGHGKSDWTPGEYTFDSIGNDLTKFLEEVVCRPAVVVGNSSGGLISLWLGANQPHLVQGVVVEDAPLLSADWPRIKEEFVFEVLSRTVTYLDKHNPDYEGLFKSMERPLPNGKSKFLPGSLTSLLTWLITNPTNLAARICTRILPRRIRRLVNDLPTFDPAFSRAWIDGTIYKGLNHDDALRRIRVPLLILHANWYRTEKGLIGAMDDDDARKVRLLAPDAEYIRMNASHGIHTSSTREFAEIIKVFAKKCEARVQTTGLHP